MGGYFALVICFMCFISVHGQGTAKPNICWNSRWFNSFIPTETNRSDYEHQSAKILDSLCTTGSPIAAQCKDQKGEPFSGYKNDTVSKFIASCNVAVGLICNPYNNTKNETCPDYQIQYGCTCPTATTARSISASGLGGNAAGTSGGVTSGTGAGVSTLKNGSGSGGGSSIGNGGHGNSGTGTTGSGTNHGSSGRQNGPGRNSGQNFRVGQIVLLTCIIMTIFY